MQEGTGGRGRKDGKWDSQGYKNQGEKGRYVFNFFLEGVGDFPYFLRKICDLPLFLTCYYRDPSISGHMILALFISFHVFLLSRARIPEDFTAKLAVLNSPFLG